MAALQVLLGAAAAAGLVLVARRRRAERAIYALGLAIVACVYLGFAAAAGAGLAAWLREGVGVAVFGTVAWLGWRRAPLWLAAGWAAHVGWDLLLHPLAGGGYAPAWYVAACIGFDLVLAGWIALGAEWAGTPEPA